MERKEVIEAIAKEALERRTRENYFEGDRRILSLPEINSLPDRFIGTGFPENDGRNPRDGAILALLDEVNTKIESALQTPVARYQVEKMRSEITADYQSEYNDQSWVKRKNLPEPSDFFQLLTPEKMAEISRYFKKRVVINEYTSQPKGFDSISTSDDSENNRIDEAFRQRSEQSLISTHTIGKGWDNTGWDNDGFYTQPETSYIEVPSITVTVCNQTFSTSFQHPVRQVEIYRKMI